MFKLVDSANLDTASLLLLEMVGSIALIVPAYNESGLVRSFVDQLTTRELHKHFTEIIFVDDGSYDATWNQLQLAVTALINVRAVRHQMNRGLGAAIRTGAIEASTDEICWIPIDQSFELVEIVREINRLDRARVVLFRRVLRDEVARDAVSFLAHLAFRLVFGCNVRHQSGLFLMRRSLFLENMPISQRAIANLEFIIRLHRVTTSIDHVSIHCHPRISGRSKTFSLRSVLRSLRELIGLIVLDPSLLKRRSPHPPESS